MMRKKLIFGLLLGLVLSLPILAHDLFLKLDSFFCRGELKGYN